MRFIISLLLIFSIHAEASWVRELNNEVKKIDKQFQGNLGVYVKKINAQDELKYNSDRSWYLASVVKVPVALAFMKEIEAGRFSLDHKVTLQQSDYVDGSGETIWKEPGTKLKVSYLIEKMLTQSDSTATDILIRLMGIDKLNDFVKAHIPRAGTFTTLLDVRYKAYSELHPWAQRLTNMDFIRIKKAPVSKRHIEFRKLAKISARHLRSQNLNDAFEKYYQKGLNSAPLSSMGIFLENFYRNNILSPTSTKMILEYMEKMTTGEKRIKAGLTQGWIFAQKTGTQVRRICNVGILRNKLDKSLEFVISACAEKFNNMSQAEQALSQVGRAISKTLGKVQK